MTECRQLGPRISQTMRQETIFRDILLASPGDASRGGDVPNGDTEP